MFKCESFFVDEKTRKLDMQKETVSEVQNSQDYSLEFVVLNRHSQTLFSGEFNCFITLHIFQLQIFP